VTIETPGLELAIAINRLVREQDEWFNDPDDHARLERALAVARICDDAISAAAVTAFRVARAQAFGEGNKRTAFLLAQWVLDRNGEDGHALLPSPDPDFSNLLVRAAAGVDVQAELVNLLRSRRTQLT
jgi:prophage maintenance system killer protein